MKNVTRLTALLLCAALLLTGLAAAINVVDPTSDYYVADYADVLSDETEKYIVDMNRILEEKTGGQIVVVTIEFLGGQNIEEYAYTLMNEWKVGSSELNNGLLLLLVTGEANYWAMSGSGIQISLTASLLAEYLNTYLEPDFQTKNYDAGVTKVFDQFLGWYSRFYKADLSAADTGTADTPTTNAGTAESDDPLQESHAIQKGGIIGKIAGWFLVIVLILAVLAVILIAVPRMIYLRKKGYRPNILSRTFWSSNPPPPPSRNRTTVNRSTGTRMGTGGTSYRSTGSSAPRSSGSGPRMGSGGTGSRSTNTGARPMGSRTVGSRNVGGSRPAQSSRPSSGGGSSRGGGAGRPGR